MNKSKRKVIPLFIILMLISTLLFGFGLITPVYGAIATHEIDFEDGILSQQYSSDSLFTTYAYVGNTYVASSYCHGGERCYKVANAEGHTCIFNFSYSTDNFITKYSFYYYHKIEPPNEYNTCKFDFRNATGTTIILLSIYRYDAGAYSEIGYTDFEGNKQFFYSSIAGNTHYQIGFSFIANDSVDYWIANTTGVKIGWANDGSPRNVLPIPRIVDCLIDGKISGQTDYSDQYLDDISFTIDDTYGEEEEYGDVSEYSYFGNIDYPNPLFVYTPYKYCEEKRFVRMSCDVKAVDLLVHATQHANAPDLSNYYLKINGYSMGNPKYWVPHGNHYLLRWMDFTVTLDRENPVLEFLHTETCDPIFPLFHWAGIATTRVGDDIDKDGESTHMRHSFSLAFNGVYDGTLYNSDLIYRMYFIGEIFPPPQTYDDVIDTDKNSYEQFETVTIAGSVSTLLYINRLVVNKSGVEYVNRTISGYTFSEFFTPTLEGVYNASIYRESLGTVKTCSFTVTVTSLLHYIYTSPNPSKTLESFTVYFKYNYTAIPCAIILFNDKDLINSLKRWRYDTVPIEDSFVYSLNTEGIYYFDLCSYHYDNATGNYVYTTIERHSHICKNEYPNQINVYYDVIELEQEQLVYGSHNFLGSNVVIKMNGETAFNVNDASLFELWYTPQYIGDYNVTLELILSDTIIILDYTFFSVSGDLPVVPEPDIFGLPIEYMHAMFGAFITLGFLIIPFAVSKGKASNIIYAIFGGMGLGIATIAGLFPIWLPFMIGIIMIAAVLLEHKKG